MATKSYSEMLTAIKKVNLENSKDLCKRPLNPMPIF